MLLLICLGLGTVWTLRAARGNAETLIGLFPVGMYLFFWFAGAVVHAFAGELAGMAVAIGGELFALLVLVAIGNRLRSRRMKEIIESY